MCGYSDYICSCFASCNAPSLVGLSKSNLEFSSFSRQVSEKRVYLKVALKSIPIAALVLSVWLNASHMCQMTQGHRDATFHGKTKILILSDKSGQLMQIDH